MQLSSAEALSISTKELTEEMRSEGMAREIVRFIQQSRKEEGLTKSEAVSIAVKIKKEAADKIRPFLDKAALSKINASSFTISESNPDSSYKLASVNAVKGLKAEIFIKKN